MEAEKLEVEGYPQLLRKFKEVLSQKQKKKKWVGQKKICCKIPGPCQKPGTGGTCLQLCQCIESDIHDSSLSNYLIRIYEFQSQ